MRRFLVVFEKTDTGFSAYLPDLPGCVATGSTKLVAEKTGSKVVVVPNSVGGDPSAKDYISLIDTILNESLKALKK